MRYESAKKRLPFDTDNMHVHSVKANLVGNDIKLNKRGESPLKLTIDKMKSSKGLESSKHQTSEPDSRLSNLASQRRASVDVNSLIFSDSFKILDDNERMAESIKNKLRSYLKV